jgi:NADH-quinone oxidoreductase subunit N
MNTYNIISINLELLIPEFFFVLTFITLIFCVSVVFSFNHIFTLYTNKISLCIIGIMLILLLNIFFNYKFYIYNFNFLFLIKFIVIFSVLCYFIVVENSILIKFEFSFLIIFSLLGFIMLIMSFDLISMYIAIEIQSISFYILTCLKKNSIFSTEAGIKYFISGALASGLLLLGCSLIYCVSGNINFENLLIIFYISKKQYLLIIGSLCVLFSIFLKLGIVPFHVWLPDIYEGTTTIITTFFFITPKLSLFIILIKFYYNIFYDLINLYFIWNFISNICALMSIWIGSIVILKQTKLKRILTYSTFAHLGYILIGLISGNLEGLQSIFFYIIIYTITNIVIWNNILHIKNFNFISELKNIYILNPFLMFYFLISFFSLAGIPPLAGFLAKLFIFVSALKSYMYLLILFTILFNIISTFYYLKLTKILIFEKILKYNFNIYIKPFSKINSILLSILIILLLILFIFPVIILLFNHYLSLFLL